MRAEWECEVRRLEETGYLQSGLDTGRKFYGVISDGDDIDEFDGSSGICFHHQITYPEFNLFRRGFQLVGGNLFHFFLQILQRQIDSRSTNGRSTTPKSADAGSDARSVAVERHHVVRF